MSIEQAVFEVVDPEVNRLAKPDGTEMTRHLEPALVGRLNGGFEFLTPKRRIRLE